MPLSVNGVEVPESMIQEEMNRVRFDPRWQAIAEEEREVLLREAGEYAATGRALIEWTADNDQRPLIGREVEAEMEKMRASGNCRPGFESLTRKQVERGLRIRRLIAELTANIEQPTLAEMENFYTANRDNFHLPGKFRAAHIVRNVSEKQTEAEARSAIELAAGELERGEDFAAVAERYSDCKDNGGDLGEFAEGVMVDEFERALRELQPGKRTGIFSTPFGLHIAELHSWTPGGPALFEDVRTDIEKVLRGIRQHQALTKGIEKLRSRATIVRTEDTRSDDAEALLRTE